MSEQIHQDHTFDAGPERIYEVLTTGAEFSAMSGGAPCEIDAVPGGAFSCFGGMIEGRNIECLPGERLVQAWRAKNWDAGVYSVVRFELEADGAQTKLRMHHIGFPQGQASHLDEGWQANYWRPLSALLSKEG